MFILECVDLFFFLLFFFSYSTSPLLFPFPPFSFCFVHFPFFLSFLYLFTELLSLPLFYP